MTPISLVVPIMKTNYSEILTLNIDYYVQVCYPFKPKYPKVVTVNSKRIFGQGEWEVHASFSQVKHVHSLLYRLSCIVS